MATQAFPREKIGRLTLAPLAAFPGFRALLWHENFLYASKGYSLYRMSVRDLENRWQFVASFSPPLWRAFSVRSRLSSRLFRDGFHALAALPSGHMVAAVPGAILSLARGEHQFRVTHRIMRGTRPLHIAVTPQHHIYWGEYFSNQDRDPVHIYGSSDAGNSWNIVYTFASGEVRHVHNIVYDRWNDCLWILTGDNGSECRVLRASQDFTRMETVLAGDQQTRAAAIVPTLEAIYFSTDTPLQSNYVYDLSRGGRLRKAAGLTSSSIYGCAVGESLFFSTMAEPSSINSTRDVQLYGSADGQHWQRVLEFRKDLWPMGFFQYGNIFLPNGTNSSDILAVTTRSVRGADLVTSLWAVHCE